MSIENKIKALVVEDDYRLSSLYTEFLEREFDVDVYVCKNVKEVEEYTSSNGVDDVDFIICDLNIPTGYNERNTGVFNGFELIENVLPGCKVIIVSGYVSPEIMKEARRLNVVSVFQKPMSFGSLAVTINFMLTCN